MGYCSAVNRTAHSKALFLNEFLQQRSGNSSSVLSKVVYRLNKFPNICAFCYKPITDESVFVPFDSQHEELQCTIGQKFDEITGETMDRTVGVF